MDTVVCFIVFLSGFVVEAGTFESKRDLMIRGRHVSNRNGILSNRNRKFGQSKTRYFQSMAENFQSKLLNTIHRAGQTPNGNQLDVETDNPDSKM